MFPPRSWLFVALLAPALACAQDAPWKQWKELDTEGVLHRVETSDDLSRLALLEDGKRISVWAAGQTEPLNRGPSWRRQK